MSPFLLMVAAAPPNYVQLIDRQVEAPSASQERLLRRLSLDIRGRPPTPEEQKELRFVALEDVAERWLASEEGARYWAAVWTDHLIRQTPGGRSNRINFKAWLAEQWKAQTPWTELSRQMLTATGTRQDVGPVSFLLAYGSHEEAAGGVMQTLLGSSIQCAQCHEHPYQEYTVRDFYGVMAFLVRTRGRREIKDIEKGHARLPDGSVVYPRWPDGPSFDYVNGADRRKALATLILKERNFARTFVNRVWAQYLGRGLIENLDDIADVSEEDKPNLKLLDQLTDAFIADGLRIRPLVLGILESRAYGAAQPGPLRFEPRSLNPEQLVLSLLSVTGLGDRRDQSRVERRAQKATDFLHATGDESSIPRVLMVMNSRALQPGYRARKGTALAQLIASEGPESERVARVIQRVLGRRPERAETAAVLALVEGKRPRERMRAYEDVFWSLLSSAEFSSHF